MARNDIRFGQAGQADFSQANAMFRISQEQLNNALATGKSTLDEINKAVTANNDAKIKQFINSFGKAELEANRDTINKFIQDVGLHSGNMYSRNEIEEYHDKRMNDLIARDNTHMLNKEKALQHENTLANHEADKFVAGITAPLYDPNKTEAQRQKVIDDMIAEARLKGSSDMTLAYASNGAYDVWGKSIDGQLGRLTGTNKIADGYLNQIVGLFEPLAREVTNAQTHLDNIKVNRDKYQSEEDYNQAVAEATQALQASQANVNGFMRANESKIPMGMQIGKFNESVANILEQQAKARQHSHKMNMDNAELERKIKADNNAFTLGMTNAGIAQQNADSNTYRALNGGKSSDTFTLADGSVVDKKDPNVKTLIEFGIRPDGTYDVKELQYKFIATMQNVKQNAMAEENKLNYAKWKSGDGKRYEELLNKRWLKNSIADVEKTFPDGITGAERAYLIKVYANSNTTINKENSKVLLNNYHKSLDNEVFGQQQAKSAEIFKALSALNTGLTEESYVALLLSDKTIPSDISRALGVDALDTFTAKRQGISVADVRANRANRSNSNQSSNGASMFDFVVDSFKNDYLNNQSVNPAMWGDKLNGYIKLGQISGLTQINSLNRAMKNQENR